MILSERITCIAIITRDRDTNSFPWGNHKGENPATSSEIESAQKVKLENSKMISRQQ